MTIKYLKNYFLNTEKPKFFLTDVFSWRGSYDEVAFTPSLEGTREESLALIERAFTDIFGGYKGGTYQYEEWTAVHFETDDRESCDIALYDILLK